MIVHRRPGRSEEAEGPGRTERQTEKIVILVEYLNICFLNFWNFFSVHFLFLLSLQLHSGIHVQPGPGPGRSELDRDFQNFTGTDPNWDFEFRLGPTDSGQWIPAFIDFFVSRKWSSSRCSTFSISIFSIFGAGFRSRFSWSRNCRAWTWGLLIW